MTTQEAFEYLTSINISFARRNGKTRFFDAINTAIKALLKQIPKKLLPPPNEDDLMFGFCPNCKEEIYCSCSELSHCCKCGQALDWSDSE